MQVSKRVVQRKVEERIEKLFLSSLTELNTQDEAIAFVEDVFSPTERVAVSKRIAIAHLLLSGYEYRSISDLLKVSLPTIWNVKKRIRTNEQGYKRAVRCTQDNEQLSNLLNEIVKTLDSAIPKLPPGGGIEKSRIEERKARRMSKKAF